MSGASTTGSENDHIHRLTIVLDRVHTWGDAERRAAAIIRRYTCDSTGSKINKVLRDASFEAETSSGRSTWTVTVKVDV